MALSLTTFAASASFPQTEISNGVLKATLYLPDAQKGFYRGTRFDWAGVVGSLTYAGHDYYGPWFTKTDPSVIDFVYRGEDIVAGPCSAITGPVEEFVSNRKALGFDEAKPGGTFIKIGVGVLRRPDPEDYNPYRLYDIVNGGEWKVSTHSDSVEFRQHVDDKATGYGYEYTKALRLRSGKPEMTIEHSLKNTGRRSIETSVYDHNFLVLDKEPIGPDLLITLPFEIRTKEPIDAKLAEAVGKQFHFRRVLAGHDTVAATFQGYGNTAADYRIEMKNRKSGAGVRIESDRPLSAEHLWSIRSVAAMEPFIDISVAPGKEFTWTYTYTYFVERGK